jgi:hypothetical protein
MVALIQVLHLHTDFLWHIIMSISSTVNGMSVIGVAAVSARPLPQSEVRATCVV